MPHWNATLFSCLVSGLGFSIRAHCHTYLLLRRKGPSPRVMVSIKIDNLKSILITVIPMSPIFYDGLLVVPGGIYVVCKANYCHRRAQENSEFPIVLSIRSLWYRLTTIPHRWLIYIPTTWRGSNKNILGKGYLNLYMLVYKQSMPAKNKIKRALRKKLTC